MSGKMIHRYLDLVMLLNTSEVELGDIMLTHFNFCGSDFKEKEKHSSLYLGVIK